MAEEAGYGQNQYSISSATFPTCWAEIPDLMEEDHRVLTHSGQKIRKYYLQWWRGRRGRTSMVLFPWKRSTKWIKEMLLLCTNWSWVWTHKVTVLLWDWSKQRVTIISISWGLFSRLKRQVVSYRFYNGVFHLCPGGKILWFAQIMSSIWCFFCGIWRHLR